MVNVTSKEWEVAEQIINDVIHLIDQSLLDDDIKRNIMDKFGDRIYIDENNNILIKRDYIKGELNHSFILVNNVLYALGKKNELAYVGSGALARVKKIIDKDGDIYALKIQKIVLNSDTPYSHLQGPNNTYDEFNEAKGIIANFIKTKKSGKNLSKLYSLSNYMSGFALTDLNERYKISGEDLLHMCGFSDERIFEIRKLCASPYKILSINDICIQMNYEFTAEDKVTINNYIDRNNFQSNDMIDFNDIFVDTEYEIHSGPIKFSSLLKQLKQPDKPFNNDETIALYEMLTDEDFCNDNKISEHEILRIALASTLALKALHDQGLIHCDVKGENFIGSIDQATGEVKVIIIDTDSCMKIIPKSPTIKSGDNSFKEPLDSSLDISLSSIEADVSSNTIIDTKSDSTTPTDSNSTNPSQEHGDSLDIHERESSLGYSSSLDVLDCIAANNLSSEDPLYDYEYAGVSAGKGSPKYMAPEIKKALISNCLGVSRADYSDRSDIYALAVMFKNDLCLHKIDDKFKDLLSENPSDRPTLDTVIKRLEILLSEYTKNIKPSV